MKASPQKLKKLKTKQVYGFKRNNFDISGNGGMDTQTLTTTLTHIVVAM